MEAGAGLKTGAGPEGNVRRGRGGSAKILAVLAGAAVLGVGVGVGSHFLARPSSSAKAASSELHGEATWAAGSRSAPPISTLHDQAGRPFSLSSLRGRTVAMVFFDSYCTQACPLAGRALASAEQSLPAAQRAVLVVVSVNPLDTPSSTRRAARKWGLAQVGAWHWLRGSHTQLARVWKAYHIFVAPPLNGDISHTEALYLIDRHGYERSGYLYPFVPRFVALDLRGLDSERQG
jgi:cytochrome oxidase Cu insertion factor (SCO1/SenC/PrrC family)